MPFNSPDIANLGVRIDTREVRGARGEFGRLATAGQRLEGVLGAAGLAGAAFLVEEAFRRSIQLGMEFESQLSDLSAITGIAGDSLQTLSERARENARITGVAARDQVEAYKLVASQLAQLIDFDTEAGVEQLRNISEEAVVLAQASRMQLSEAVQAVTTTINQFSLEAADATEVVNNLAAGAKFGAAEVPQITTALTEAGAAAASAGEDFNTTIAAIEVLAANAITGSRAGTGLRNVFLRLQTESDKLAKYGLTDVNIQTDGLAETLERLIPLQENATALTEIFGQEAFNAASILIRNVDALQDLEEQTRNTNTAYEQQQTQTDNLRGDLNKLWETVKGGALVFYEDINPALRVGVDLLGGLADVAGSAYEGIATFVDSAIIDNVESLVDGYQAMSNILLILQGRDFRTGEIIVDEDIQKAQEAQRAFSQYVDTLLTQPDAADKAKGANEDLSQSMLDVSAVYQEMSLTQFDIYLSRASRIRQRHQMLIEDIEADLESLTEKELDTTTEFGVAFEAETSAGFIDEIETRLANITNRELDLNDDALQQALRDIRNETTATERAAQDLGFSFSSAFEDAILRGESLQDTLQAIGQDVARIFLRTAITQPFGEDLADAFSNILPNARGNVFSNSIVDRPTLFPMASGAGLMAESGPEAVMPLTRTPSGDLGVKSTGGNVEVNVINNSGAEVQVQEQPSVNGGTRLDIVVENIVAKSIARRGPAGQAMESTYGLQRLGRRG